MLRKKYSWLTSLGLVMMTGLLTVSSYAQRDLIHILSPSSGHVVRPGETLAIAVAADTSVQRLALIGQHPLGMARIALGGATEIVAQGQGEGHSLQFLLTIPTAIQPGIYHVTAVGRVSDSQVESETLALDVEKTQEPTRIWAEPFIIQFTRLGDQIPLRVLGSFSDGSQVELTRSTKTKYASADPRVAAVTNAGLVTSIGVGKTSILVRTSTADYSIPVRVQDEH
jgi:hypothetical protein